MPYCLTSSVTDPGAGIDQRHGHGQLVGLRRFPFQHVAVAGRLAQGDALDAGSLPANGSTPSVFDRRAKVVGIFPNSNSLLRLFTAVLQDQHDEWQDGRRHFSQQSMARVMHPDGPPLLTNPLTEGLVA